MSNLADGTLAPIDFYAPERPPKVVKMAEVPINQIKPENIASSPGYIGNVFGKLTPVEMVELCLERAKAYLDNRDPMQASEKLYKATEDSIKYLAEHYQLDEYKDALKQGNWWHGVLSRASKHLAKDTGKKEIDDAWTKAFDLHVNGFHENALNVEDVLPVVPIIEKLVQYVREVSNGRGK